MGYTAYVLSDETRRQVLAHFPPKFPRVIAEHITDVFGVDAGHPLPSSAKIEIYGYACIDGLEALAVRVNGQERRADGGLYHITLSLDPYKTVAKELFSDPVGIVTENYRPAHSNLLLAAKAGWQDVAVPIDIRAEPKFLEHTLSLDSMISMTDRTMMKLK